MDLQKLKFPIGKYVSISPVTPELLESWITEIEDFPNKLQLLTSDLSTEQLNWKYRPDGWTLKQVVHHCADSHLNSLMRFKLTLTEKQPIIRPYFEDRWAELPDAVEDDITNSILFIRGLHGKWCSLLRNLTKEQLEMKFIHPEGNKIINLTENIGIYAWHCRHHLSHIKNGIGSNGKYN